MTEIYPITEEKLMEYDSHNGVLEDQDGLAYTPEDFDFTDPEELRRQQLFDDGFEEGYDAGVNVTRSIDRASLDQQKAAIRRLHTEVSKGRRRLIELRKRKDVVDRHLYEARRVNALPISK